MNYGQGACEAEPLRPPTDAEVLIDREWEALSKDFIATMKGHFKADSPVRAAEAWRYGKSDFLDATMNKSTDRAG